MISELALFCYNLAQFDLATEENEIVKKQSYVLDTLGLILHYCGLSLLSQSIFENILHPLLQQVSRTLLTVRFFFQATMQEFSFL